MREADICVDLPLYVMHRVNVGKCGIKATAAIIKHLPCVLKYLNFVMNRSRCPRNCSGNLRPGLEVIKLEYSLGLKIKRTDWLLVDSCPQAANHCSLF